MYVNRKKVVPYTHRINDKDKDHSANALRNSVRNHFSRHFDWVASLCGRAKRNMQEWMHNVTFRLYHKRVKAKSV
jgi:hypothetical protein